MDGYLEARPRFRDQASNQEPKEDVDPSYVMVLKRRLFCRMLRFDTVLTRTKSKSSL